MMDAGAFGAILMIGGGLETTLVAANHMRKRLIARDRLDAQGASLSAAFTADEQADLPSEMLDLLNRLDTPGGAHGGQGC